MCGKSLLEESTSITAVFWAAVDSLFGTKSKHWDKSKFVPAFEIHKKNKRIIIELPELVSSFIFD